MGRKDSKHIPSLSTLQLAAIITVFIGHFWVNKPDYMNSVCVSFCFVYSGFFTALHHRFPSTYGWKGHMRFMWKKFARLYPLHVLAFAVVGVLGYVMWDKAVEPSVILAHLTLTSSWIPFQEYFFGINPVAWYICDLFFLYLMAPVLVRALRKVSVAWQVVIIVALMVTEYTLESRSLLGAFHYYFIYQCPVTRLLDYATGITLYNLTQCGQWNALKGRINATSATVIEVCSVVLFLVMFMVGKDYLHPHCYRGLCVGAPAIVSLFVPFVLTSGCGGLISRVLSFRPFIGLSGVGAEIYLMQLSSFFLVSSLFRRSGYMPHPVSYFVIQMSALLLVAWVVHRCYTLPVSRLLTGTKKAAPGS